MKPVDNDALSIGCVETRRNLRLAKLKKFAKDAHEPVEEGVFFNREIHEKDRRAKFSGRHGPAS